MKKTGPEGVIVEVYKYLGKRHKIRIKTKLIDFSITYIIRLLNTSPLLIISCTPAKRIKGSAISSVLILCFHLFSFQWLTVCQTYPFGSQNIFRTDRQQIWLAVSILVEINFILWNGTRAGMSFTDICQDRIRSSKLFPSKEWKSM